MRKQAIVHLHGLLAEVAICCEQEYDLAIDLTEYRALETTRMSINKQKEEHQEAVLALAEAITGTLSDKRKTMPPVNAD